jgi:hypothetical protein
MISNDSTVPVNQRLKNVPTQNHFRSVYDAIPRYDIFTMLIIADRLFKRPHIYPANSLDMRRSPPCFVSSTKSHPGAVFGSSEKMTAVL